MRINIIYASWFGNGKRVVEELAEILIEKKQDVKQLCSHDNLYGSANNGP